MHYYKGDIIPQNYHTFASSFILPKNGSHLMTPAITPAPPRPTVTFQFNQVALRSFETAIHAERDEAMSSHLTRWDDDVMMTGSVAVGNPGDADGSRKSKELFFWFHGRFYCDPTLLVQPSPQKNKVLLREFYLWWFITGPLDSHMIVGWKFPSM